MKLSKYMYKLQLHVKKGEISLSLKNGRKVVDALVWDDETNMSERLLVEIDKMLRKNMIQKEDVGKMTVKSDIPVGYSTVRIARTVIRAWNWGNSLRIIPPRRDPAKAVAN